MKVLAIIPARGGSKGVPGKNLKLLGGRPLLEYAIHPALQCKRVDRVIVSTDDEAIAQAAKQAGAEVPFMRPAALATDTTPDKPVFEHALDWLSREEGYHPDFVLNLRCTTPFKTAEDIDRVIDTWQESGADSVRTVTRVDGVFHPYWMYQKEVDGYARPFVEGIKLSEYYQRQLLPPCYRLNGLVDGVASRVLLHHTELYGDKMAVVETDEARSVDIDTLLDFELAEFRLQKGMVYGKD